MRLSDVFRVLSERAPLVLALGVFVGLFAGELASALRPLLPVAIAGLLFIAMLRTDWPMLLGQLKRPLLLCCLVMWLLVICPVITWGVVRTLGLPLGLGQALILMASVPPLFSSPALALLLGLDASLVLAIVGVTTLISPFTLAAVASTLTTIDLQIEPFALMARLGGLILGCALAAALTRRAAGMRRIAGWGHICDSVSVLLLIVFAIAVMDGIGQRVIDEPVYVAVVTLVAFVAHVLLQVLTALVCVSCGLRLALSAGFVGGNRAMGLLLAVLPQSAPPDVLLYFALGQVPMYVMPAVLAPLYVRLLGGRSSAC